MTKTATIVGIALLAITQSFAQSTPTKQQAGDCSINDVGSNNQLTIDCRGISKEQGQKILAILNKMLANQIDADKVMAKLDEILHAVNPNLPTKAYFCKGGWRSVGPGPNIGIQMTMNGGEDPSGQQMAKLADAGQFKELLKVCTAQIESKPEWLTPRLFCGLAYAEMGDNVKAKEMVKAYDDGKGPAYDGDSFCRQFSDLVHSKLK